jgi:tRNA nucleotidyltransferase (CCA-adding enzyme)
VAHAEVTSRPVADLLDRAPADLRARVDAARLVAERLGAPVWWAGGGVRDLLLGRPPTDLDLVIEGRRPAGKLALELARSLAGKLTHHARFDTFTVVLGDGSQLDVATARRETYDRPGALPRVDPGDLAHDLERRDFTVNAIALRLAPLPVELVDPCGGREDLAAGRLRTLHPGSFADDATRILRGLRFELRLGLRLAPATEAEARKALAAGYLDGISGPRLRRELAKLLGDPATAAAALRRSIELGVPRALVDGLEGDEEDATRLRVALREASGLPWHRAALEAPRTALLALLALALGTPADLRRRLSERLRLPATEADVLTRGPERIESARGRLRSRSPSPAAHEIAAALRPLSAEELALLAASGEGWRRLVERDLSTLRPLRLRVTGSDLRAAGVPAGPAIGRALELTLAARLDGALDADGELEFALDACSREGRA